MKPITIPVKEERKVVIPAIVNNIVINNFKIEENSKYEVGLTFTSDMPDNYLYYIKFNNADPEINKEIADLAMEYLTKDCYFKKGKSYLINERKNINLYFKNVGMPL